MKKVGIATYIKGHNYGSVLQALALQDFIDERGYDAWIIDFLDMHLMHNKFMRLLVLAKSSTCFLKNPGLFIKFIKERKLSTKKIVETPNFINGIFKNFHKNNLKYDSSNYFVNRNFAAFVCGSDQVWKLTVPGLHAFFFLQFAPPQKRVAYAPSFGCDYLPKYNKARLSSYLQSFAYISVREKSGQELLKRELGLDIPQVLDPVLMVGKNYWQNKIRKIEPLIQGKYILCYFLNNSTCGEAVAIKLSKKTGYRIVCIVTGNKSTSIGDNCYPTPLEFVKLIDEAEYVVTDSFHGVAFSILMNTNFYVVKREYIVEDGQQTRIDSILNIVGLEETLVKSSFDFHKDIICFKKINLILEKEQEISRKYLINALRDVIERGDK